MSHERLEARSLFGWGNSSNINVGGTRWRFILFHRSRNLCAVGSGRTLDEARAAALDECDALEARIKEKEKEESMARQQMIRLFSELDATSGGETEKLKEIVRKALGA